ncbi:MAG: mechanosensitive ion channel family protein [Burkholderiales bacterium]|nr:mechanosensitive ion channel family protein [Burkholderiales bacterium]
MPTDIPNIEHAQKAAIDLAIRFGPKLVVAILLIVAGFYVGRWLARMLGRWLERLELEPPVRHLLERMVLLVVLGLFGIMALQNLGIDLLPLIAGLGVAGAGVALAMQGVLGNLVAGLTIIFTRPFRVGEYVAMVGVEGRVEEIELFSTHLSHTDGSIVVVPNRKIVGEILHNYGQVRQLDLGVVLSRPGDLEATLALVGQVVEANPRVLKEPRPVIGVTALADTGYRIAVKPWVAVPDVVAASGEINRAIVEALRGAAVHYPMLPPGEALLEAAQRRA